jgi:hypothetical protein
VSILTTPTRSHIPAGYVEAMCVGCNCAMLVEADQSAFVVCRSCERANLSVRVPVDVGRIDGDALVELIAIADESGNDDLLDSASARLCQLLGIDPDAADRAETVEAEEDGERFDGMS